MRVRTWKTQWCSCHNAITLKDVEQIYAIDSSLPVRMTRRLSYKYLSLPPFTTINESLAPQVLSRSVAAGIRTICMTGDELDGYFLINYSLHKMWC